MSLLRNFTAFYGTVSSILYQKCSITFFDFYAIHMIGLRQKILIFVTFAKLLRGDIHKTLCYIPLFWLVGWSIRRLVGNTAFLVFMGVFRITAPAKMLGQPFQSCVRNYDPCPSAHRSVMPNFFCCLTSFLVILSHLKLF